MEAYDFHRDIEVSYIGRFAPSPTGLLHFGSLLAATASYLEARSQHGRWLLRLEDVDRPRERAGAADAIIHTLQAYGFEWDDGLVYQSHRQQAYHTALAQLRPHTYACTCSRKQMLKIARMGTCGLIYPGTCRSGTNIPSTPHTIRLRTEDRIIYFQDAVQGNFCQNVQQEVGDFILRRADHIYAYQLAVVVDDAWQGITHVVRGADLLDNTPRQLYLQSLLGFPQPKYLHIPLAINQYGQKLSKQTHAPAIDTRSRVATLCEALRFLGQQPPEASELSSLRECWDWAIHHWDTSQIPAHVSP